MSRIDCKSIWMWGAILLLTLLVLFGLITSTESQEILRPSGRRAFFPMASPTPTPGGVDCNVLCGVPGSIWCSGDYLASCSACWLENCGVVLATPTPTPTRTPTPTPTPGVWPYTCSVTIADGAGLIDAMVKVYYPHEDPDNHTLRYMTSKSVFASGHVNATFPGGWYDGAPPVGVEWFIKPHNAPESEWTLARACGDTSRDYPPTPTPTPGPALIYADGFETGDASAWSKEVP